jgi:CubicO group peptidase (beta-lactamase class C family)
MIVRHGHVVAEGWWVPYAADVPHQLYSLSKSFTSTAIGLAAAEGKLKLTDPVLQYFPDFAPADASDNLKAMRIRDLLIMSTGHEKEPSFGDTMDPWAKSFLAAPVPHKPGTHFLYNSAATYTLAAILQRVTGEGLVDYLQPRLFAPLGIDRPVWDTNPEGIATGGWGLDLRTEDIAKFGQLLLQQGEWNGRQLLPRDWIAEATARQTSNGSDPTNDWQQGYGYQFWRCRPSRVYRGDGAFGQFCIVLPEQDAVVAITAGTPEMQALMNAVWDHLIPAFQPAPLPSDPAGNQQLAARLAALSLPPQPATPVSPRAAEFAGKVYTFAANNDVPGAISYTLSADSNPVFCLQTGDRVQTVACAPGGWTKTRLAFGGRSELPYATSGAWTADDTFTLKLCAYSTPFLTTVRLKFTPAELTFESELNVSFGPRTLPPQVGKCRL